MTRPGTIIIIHASLLSLQRPTILRLLELTATFKDSAAVPLTAASCAGWVDSSCVISWQAMIAPPMQDEGLSCSSLSRGRRLGPLAC
ncbi:hypothetical protein V8E36_005432 [Tilletia maclaganii]